MTGGACVATTTGSCRCKTSAECPSHTCAPATDQAGNPVGPYVCVPMDGQPYHGCNGMNVTCAANGTCCVTDTNGNNFCATACTSNAQCGSAHCDPFTFKLTTCKGPSTACGP